MQDHREFLVVLAVIAAEMNLDLLAAIRGGLIVPNPFKESIPKSGLARERHLPPIFVQNTALKKTAKLFVEDDFPSLGDFLQSLYARRYTGEVRLRRTALIGNNGDIRIDDERFQDCFSIRRLTMALAVSAISPTSSPKKSFGQLAILPNESRLSGVSADASFSISQK